LRIYGFLYLWGYPKVNKTKTTESVKNKVFQMGDLMNANSLNVSASSLKTMA
jgi:hypothetical protein